MPALSLYSATKVFDSFLAEGLSYELSDKIDVMSYMAGKTATKLLGNPKTDHETIAPERAA